MIIGTITIKICKNYIVYKMVNFVNSASIIHELIVYKLSTYFYLKSKREYDLRNINWKVYF